MVVKVVSAPARFWDRGARYFVVRLYLLAQLDDELSVFWRRFAGSLKQGQPRIRCAGKKSYRRGRLEATCAGGTNRGHAVEATRGYWEIRGDRLSGSVMERAA